MKTTIVVFVLMFCLRIYGVEYGLLFKDEVSYLLSDYATLCDDSTVKFEVFINTTSGVLMLAENKMKKVSLIVYFERPGMYINVTDGDVNYNLPLTLDFFSSYWYGWHELQLKLTETSLQLKFDNAERKANLQDKHIFPEEFVEDNEIYFGAGPHWTNVGNVTRFSGVLKNIQVKSCGCNVWKPVMIVKNMGVNVDNQGECTSMKSCKKECSCYLFSWGGHRCECPREPCIETSNNVRFSFNKAGGNSQRLKEFSKSNWTSKDIGPFGSGMEISPGNSLILYVSQGRTCFRNVFLCENGFAYHFWILSNTKSEAEEVSLILKHSSSLEAPYGLTVLRIRDFLDVTVINSEGTASHIRSPLILSVWNLVTIISNQTHLSLYVDSYLQQSSNRFIKHSQKLLDLSSTRFLFIGNNRNFTDVSIDNFEFSTNISDYGASAIQELRLEQYKDIRKTNVECSVIVEKTLVDLMKCYKNTFTSSNLLTFYISLIFSVVDERRTNLLQAPFINILIESSKVLKIEFPGRSSHYVSLVETIGRLYYLEFSLNDKGEFIILQSLDVVLLKVNVDIGVRDDLSHRKSLQVNSDFKILRHVRIINTDRSTSSRALRIISKYLKQYSVDFDRSDIDDYENLQLTQGYVDQGLSLRYPSSQLFTSWFKGSCLKHLASCYHGVTLTFWLKITNKFKNFTERFYSIFSSGKQGLSVILDLQDLYFIVTIESRVSYKFEDYSLKFSFNHWHLVEISKYQNDVVLLYLNRQQSQAIPYNLLKYPTKCPDICLGEERSKEDSLSITIDEIKVWDVERLFLYANEFISSGPSRHKLISFTNYQLNRSFSLEGSAKILSTKSGNALGLNGFGYRFGSINLTDGPRCFWDLNYCRRGISIRMWLRPDNLAISQQTLLAGSFVSVTLNLQYLVIQVRAFGKSWHVITKDILQLFTWQMLEISWRDDDGLKVYINGRLSGSTNISRENSVLMSRIFPTMNVGIEYLNTDNIDFATVVIDDIEFFEGDKSNLAYETYPFDDILCVLRVNFEDISNTTVTPILGVVGSGGLFRFLQNNMEIHIPACFNVVISGCEMCFTLRLWLNVYQLKTELFEGGFLKISVMASEIIVEINEVFREKSLHFSCHYGQFDLLKKWNFIEVSWDIDEGLLIFINRDIIMCTLTSTSTMKKPFKSTIEISKDFFGAIDELEMYHMRISLLYWKKVINESKTLVIIERIKEKEKILKEVELVKKALNSKNVNQTVEIVESFKFNGSNYVSYKLPQTIYPYIPGGREEVDLSFMCFNNMQSSIIWISDSKFSKSTLTLKNKKLYFSKFYILPSSNTSKRLTEELEIHNNILPNILYNVVIYQRAGEITMKTTSLNQSNTQSMIGRDPLLPMDSNVYFGGYNNDKYLQSNQINSQLLGIIYKARLKASFNDKMVDIIQEMADAKSNPSIINYGDVKILKKNIKLSMVQEASFLATLSSRKVPLMINSPFFSMSLPKWDFNFLTSIEIEFTTYESRGILLFIGNCTDFVALEIYDSQLYFLYKYNNVSKRVRINGNLASVSDYRVYSVYLGRDLSGNIKIYFNRDGIMEDTFKIIGFDNSVTVIGHLGTYALWPLEILSRVSIVGCINFVRINDEDYINFTQDSPLMKYKIFNFYKNPTNIRDAYSKGSCEVPSSDSCHDFPCGGGWCQLTGNSALGQLNDRNFKCNCLYSSKALILPFTQITSQNNFDVWMYEYLLQSRSKPCTEDTRQIVVVEQSFLSINFRITFPFVSVMDLELLVLVKSKNNCIMELALERKYMSIIISEGKLLINVSPENVITFSEINFFDNQWHGVQIQGRAQSITVTIGNLQRDFYSSSIPSFNVSAIKIGNCGGYSYSNFKIKSLNYNNLNLLSLGSSSDDRLFYTSKYSFPTIKEYSSLKTPSFDYHPVTFLNNFQAAATLKPFRLSWFTQIHVSFSTIYPGVLFYINNDRKFLACVLCNNNDLIFIHYDNSLKPQIVKVKINNQKIKFTLTIDLIREVIKFKKFDDLTEKRLSLGINSWNVGDFVYVRFGVNGSNNGKLNFGDFVNDQLKCLVKGLVTPLFGCLETFIWFNGNNSLSFNNDWFNLVETNPRNSILYSECKVVEKCLPNSCANGVCKSNANFKVFCDCSFTDFTGDRCHEVKDKCRSVKCFNNGKCISTKNSEGMQLTYCNCSGTGYTGRNCEEIRCEKDFCLNNGTCYTTSSAKYCNCNLTNFSGLKCEMPTCKAMTCTSHGACKLISKVNAPMCHCYHGFFGEYCDKSSLGKCETICKNGGVCSSHHPIFKLCSNQYCNQSTVFTCNCDHTFYRGDMCDQVELGFLPLKDGVVVMTNITLEQRNYFRILFEPSNQREKTTLLSIFKSQQESLKFLLVNNIFTVEYNNKLQRETFAGSIGNVSNKNVFLLIEKDSKIEFYFNNKIQHFQYSDLKFQKTARYRRDLPIQSSFSPTIIVGCNEEMNNCFNGLIGGIRWNNRLLLDKQNKIFKDGYLHSIETLHIRPFPTSTSFLMLIDKKDTEVISLCLVIVVIVALFIFTIITKQYCRRNTTNKVYRNNGITSEISLIEPVEVDQNYTIPDRSPDISFQSKYESKLTVKSISSSETSISDCCRILVINDIDAVNTLTVIDCIPVPKNQIVLVTNYLPEIKVYQSLFPIDPDDMLYKCVKIDIAPNGHYIYCHMTSLQAGVSELFEIQAWKVRTQYQLLIRPPNVQFTHSNPFRNESYQMILLNNNTLTISLFDIEVSSVLWTSSMEETYPKLIEPFLVLDTILKLIINKELYFEIIDINDGTCCGKHKPPLLAYCRQILDIDDTGILILTNNYDLYYWDMETGYFNHQQFPQRVTLMTRPLKSKGTLALGMENGEVYISREEIDGEYIILGPRNDNNITCLKFSTDGDMLAAAYDNNLVHVWKIGYGPALCHFHAVHERGVLYNMNFIDENKKLIVEVFAKRNSQRNQKKISIVNIASN